MEELKPRKIPFRELRVLILERGYYAKDLARAIGMGESTMSMKLNGKAPWTMAEAYAVCDALGVSYEKIPVLFPKKDVTA